MSHICFDSKSPSKHVSILRKDQWLWGGAFWQLRWYSRGDKGLGSLEFWYVSSEFAWIGWIWYHWYSDMVQYIMYILHTYIFIYVHTDVLHAICSWRCFLLIGEICQIEVMRRLKSAAGLKSWDSWRLQEKTSRFSFFCSYLLVLLLSKFHDFFWRRCIWIWQAAFYMIGGMSDVKEKAAKLAAVAAGKWRGWWRRVAFILWATESQRATILWSEI